MSQRRSLVVTADDFGLASAVNEAVERGHRDGILSAASLMVGERWAQDAVERARGMPGLAVGLHLTLVEGRPVLPPARIPDLVREDGQLRVDLARYGTEIVLKPHVRAQVAAEIEAQFEAFGRTGLPLDHVNAHQHYHLHPTVAALVLAIGPRFGMRGLRVPVEPAPMLAQIERVRIGWPARLTAPWARGLRAKARRAGLVTPDQVFGLAWSGAMTAARVAGLMRELPPGRTEIYLHPAVCADFAGCAPGYRYVEEFAALLSGEVLDAMRSARVSGGGYAGWESRGRPAPS